MLRELKVKAVDSVMEALRIRDIKAWFDIRKNPLFDYGAAPSFRKSRERRKWQHFFQQTDSDLHGRQN